MNIETIDDFKTYLEDKNYTSICVMENHEGFYAVLREKPNLKDFTQINCNMPFDNLRGYQNTVRLSFNDVNNEEILKKH